MIQMVLFLSYASSEELGYDKTMRLLEGNKYEVDVGTLTQISVDFMLNILLISDLTLALEIIHRLKCVHRDVSTVNILFYEGMGRLSDLEFLKKFSSLNSHEVKTVCLHASSPKQLDTSR